MAFNRRDFLKISAAGAAVSAVPNVLNAITTDSPSVTSRSGQRLGRNDT